MRYIIALAAISAGAFCVFGDRNESVDYLPSNGSGAKVPPELNKLVEPDALLRELVAGKPDQSESRVDTAIIEQPEVFGGQASSASDAIATFDLGPFIDPDDMSTWPEGQEVIVGEYIDPDEFYADEQPPVEIGEWIDPDVEYAEDLSDPIEIGGYEDPDEPTPSQQEPIEVGAFVDPDNP